MNPTILAHSLYETMQPRTKKQKTLQSPSSVLLCDYDNNLSETITPFHRKLTSTTFPIQESVSSPCVDSKSNKKRLLKRSLPQEKHVDANIHLCSDLYAHLSSYRESALVLNDIGTKLFSLGKDEEATIMYDTAIEILQHSKCSSCFTSTNSSSHDSTSNQRTISTLVVKQNIELGRQLLTHFGGTANTDDKNNKESAKGTSTKQSAFEEHPLDTYLGGICDVGPRPFRTPIPSPSCTIDNENGVLEGTVLFNRALVYHSKSMLDSAIVFYEEALCAITRDAVSSFVLPTADNETIVYEYKANLETLIRNNIGQIKYVEGDLDKATVCFNTAFKSAEGLSNKDYSHKNNTELTIVHRIKQKFKLTVATVISNSCRIQWLTMNHNNTAPILNSAYNNIYGALEQVLALRLAVLDHNHVDIASAHYNLGIIAYSKGKNQVALSHFKEYVAIQDSLRTDKNCKRSMEMKGDTRQQEEDNASTSCLNTSSSLISSSSGGNTQLSQAISCASTPNTCPPQASPPGSPSKAKPAKLEMIPTLVYILLIKNEHEHDELSLQLKKCLHLILEKRQSLGTVHIEIAKLLNYCGALLFEKRQLSDAIEFYKEELRVEQKIISAKTLTKQTPVNKSCLPETVGSNYNVIVSPLSLAVTFNNIGRVLQECGKYRRALQFYNRALKTKPNAFGDVYNMNQGSGGKVSVDTIDTATTMTRQPAPSEVNLFATVWYNLGLTHDSLGSPADAIEAFHNSLRLRKLILGPDHPDVSCLWYNIGTLQMENNMLIEASSSFNEAFRIRKLGVTCTQSDRHAINSMLKLASLHKKRGNIGESIKAYENVLYFLKEDEKCAPLSSTSENDCTPAHDDNATSTSMSNSFQIGETLHSLSELHHMNEDMHSALITAHESTDVFKVCMQQATDELAKLSSSASSCNCRSTLNSWLNIIEQAVKSYLYLGSLYHECCDPILANNSYENAKRAIENVQRLVEDHNSGAFRTDITKDQPSLSQLLEIIQLLISSSCAAMA